MVNPHGYLSDDQIETSPPRGRSPRRDDESEDSQPDLDESQDYLIENEDGSDDGGIGDPFF